MLWIIWHNAERQKGDIYFFWEAEKKGQKLEDQVLVTWLMNVPLYTTAIIPTCQHKKKSPTVVLDVGKLYKVVQNGNHVKTAFATHSLHDHLNDKNMKIVMKPVKPSDQMKNTQGHT